MHLIDLELYATRILQRSSAPQLLVDHGLECLSSTFWGTLHLPRHVHRYTRLSQVFRSQDENEIVLHLLSALDLLAQGLAASVGVDQKGRIHR